MQEVRASTEDLQELLGTQWDILHDPATAKGRAGVALASRAGRTGAGHPFTASTSAPPTSTAPGAGSRPTTRSTAARHRGEHLRALRRGRHPQAGGEVQVPRRDGRAVAGAGGALRARRRPGRPQRRATASSTSATGRATARTPGSCPRSAPTSTGSSAGRRGVDGRDDNVGPGLGWVDVGRRWAGEVDGPYTWWSLARQGLRQRHRMAHRLPPRDPGARRAVTDYRSTGPSRGSALVGPRAGRRRLRHLTAHATAASTAPGNSGTCVRRGPARTPMPPRIPEFLERAAGARRDRVPL